MPLTERQAQSLADELIASAKLESQELRNSTAVRPSLVYRYGLHDLASFDATDQAMLVQRAKAQVRRGLVFRVALLSVIVANSALVIAWFTGLLQASSGALLPTTLAWLNVGLVVVLWAALVRHRTRTIVAAALRRLDRHP